MSRELAAYKDAVRLIKVRGPAVVFTGAGMSAESGVPTFRGDDGIWQKYPPSQFASIPGLVMSFLLRPRKLHSFVIEVLDTFARALPNKGHLALAKMERSGYIRGVITQNVDNLHQDAGSKILDEIHGNIFRFKCYRCEKTSTLDKSHLVSIVTGLHATPSGRVGLFRLLRQNLLKCPDCGGTRRPDIVFFGEVLPQEAWKNAALMAATCKVMLVVGTSGIVYPAAELPLIASTNGATIVEVNPVASPITHLAEVHISERASQALQVMSEMIAG